MLGHTRPVELSILFVPRFFKIISAAIHLRVGYFHDKICQKEKKDIDSKYNEKIILLL